MTRVYEEAQGCRGNPLASSGMTPTSKRRRAGVGPAVRSGTRDHHQDLSRGHPEAACAQVQAHRCCTTCAPANTGARMEELMLRDEDAVVQERLERDLLKRQVAAGCNEAVVVAQPERRGATQTGEGSTAGWLRPKPLMHFSCTLPLQRVGQSCKKLLTRQNVTLCLVRSVQCQSVVPLSCPETL
eukprot:680917-Amphidinium_carterae.2